MRTAPAPGRAGARLPPLPVVLSVLAGVLGALQPKVNAVLAERVGSSFLAALVNFGGAAFAAGTAVAVRARTRRAVGRIRTARYPRWALTAGLWGVVVVLAGAVAVRTVGVAVFSVAFFAGQLSCGLIVDRLGVGVGGRRAITWSRAVASGLAVLAVASSQLGRPVGSIAPALVLFVVVAGATSAFQAACNGRVGAAVGDPLLATALNVAIGLSALATIVAVLGATGLLPAADWPSEPWLYVGGLLGFVIVLGLTVGAATIGVLRTTVVMLGAQLLTAIGLDAAVDGRAPTAGVVAGAALVVGAVVLVGRRSAQTMAGPK